ncbi:MAG: RNA polymerase factor sigma-54 [Desulfovibrio sp.]|nr:RNA polymerase factor sigma-54 [Desulfovibrio sp.]
MALELRQNLKMQQSLVMTPQLRQAIKLLQLSRLELEETIQQEMLENPFLEEKTTEARTADQETETPTRKESHEDEVYDSDVAKDAQWEDYLGEFSSTSRQMQNKEREALDEITSFESRYAAKPTLEAHLLWQLHFSQLTEEEIAIGEEIIGNLSSSGYLEAEIDEIAQKTGKRPEKVEEVLRRIQLFDPVGVAARDARECLLIQIKNLHYDRDPILVSLVLDHLEDIEMRRYKPLLKKFHLDQEDLEEYLAIIKDLEPMPGASFGDGEPTYICPDVYVYKVNGEFVIALNEDGLPDLQLSDLAKADMSHASEKEREYCTQKIRSASWLIKSLYQRQRTLYKVTESIVRHQQAFFEEGATKLVPLILKDIADDIEMHESTVSRITTNKYVATPFGVFELKYFFNSALEQADGSLVGSESVKTFIKDLIAGEDPADPLSDEHLALMLKSKLNVNIARRTVAKYRTQLGIESSSKRKSR